MIGVVRQDTQREAFVCQSPHPQPLVVTRILTLSDLTSRSLGGLAGDRRREDFAFMECITVDQANGAAEGANRKALEHGCIGIISGEDVLIVHRYFNSTCVYCGRQAHDESTNSNPVGIDHIDPLSRGGLNAIENLVCCCRACNSSKSNKDVREWLVHVNRNVFVFEDLLLDWQTFVYKREIDPTIKFPDQHEIAMRILGRPTRASRVPGKAVRRRLHKTDFRRS